MPLQVQSRPPIWSGEPISAAARTIVSVRGRNLRARDGRDAPPQDPRLLPSDVGVGRTEYRGVLEVDAGNDGNDWIDHVG